MPNELPSDASAADEMQDGHDDGDDENDVDQPLLFGLSWPPLLRGAESFSNHIGAKVGLPPRDAWNG